MSGYDEGGESRFLWEQNRVFCVFLQLRVGETAVAVQQSVLVDKKIQLRNESWTFCDRIHAVVEFFSEV